MSGIPASMLAVRDRLARRYISGQGIEIGALDSPTAVPATAKVTYVDRLPDEALRKQYPLMKDATLFVDLIDDGERLARFAAGSLDFVIANHFLEHCENPLGAMRSHLNALRAGGILYYAVPDRDCGFDAGRPITTWQHLVDDDVLGPERSRREHHLEFVRAVRKDLTEIQVQKVAACSLRESYSIHFHVWTERAFRKFIADAREYLDRSFSIEHQERNQNESIAILKRVAR